MEDFRIDVKGFWTAGEVSELAERLLGVAIECTTEDVIVIVHPRPRALTTVERARLAEALVKEERPSAAERMAEAEAEKAATAQARQEKFTTFKAKAEQGKASATDLTEIVLVLVEAQLE